MVFSSDGSVKLFVHCQPVSINPYLSDVRPPLLLDGDDFSMNYFVDRCIEIVNKVRQMEICSGFEDDKFKSVCQDVLLERETRILTRSVDMLRLSDLLHACGWCTLKSGGVQSAQSCTNLYRGEQL